MSALRPEAVLPARLRAQLLTGPAVKSPEDVVSRILAVQAQDGRGARLAIRLRSTGPRATDVDRALNERRLVVSWLNRGTLHLVKADDYWWLHPLTAPQMTTSNKRRLDQTGVSPSQAERGVEVVSEALSSGPATRAELKSALSAAGIPTAGQALVHLLGAASVASRLVRGPMRGKEHCFVDPRSWLGTPPPPIERSEALSRLARRYLAGHGPAGAADLAKWAGIGLGEAMRGFSSIAEETQDRPDGLIDLLARDPAAGLPPPRLAGPFDPLLHGWSSAAGITAGHDGIITTNGLFRPFALVGGLAVATWGLSGGRVRVRLLERLREEVIQALSTEALAVLSFFGLAPAPPVFEE